MRRRDFVTGLACAAATWRVTALAQQHEGMRRRIGTLTGIAGEDVQTSLSHFWLKGAP
jgi:hypothetical protein